MLFLGRVGETEDDQVWAWEEAMHVSAMKGFFFFLKKENLS